MSIFEIQEEGLKVKRRYTSCQSMKDEDIDGIEKTNEMADTNDACNESNLPVKIQIMDSTGGEIDEPPVQEECLTKKNLVTKDTQPKDMCSKKDCRL